MNDGTAFGITASDIDQSVTTEGLTLRQRIGLILAPLACLLVWFGPMPAGTTGEMRAVAALTLTMALLWVCESIPLAATALLPLVFLPVSGVAKPAEAAQSYAGDLVFLFIGGFVLSNGVARWGLHRRIALWLLGIAGTNKRGVVGGLMGATAFISLWISNTAAALLMLPVGLSVVHTSGSKASEATEEGEDPNFATSMVLGIAVAATIGGMGTPIGSTPNLLFVNTLERTYKVDVSFLQWMAMGIPLVVIFTLFAWWLFTFILFPPKPTALAAKASTVQTRGELGKASLGEWLTGSIFLLTALGWIFRETRTVGGLTFGLTQLWPNISDGTIALAGAIALFGIPVSLRPMHFALDWERGGKIPWDVILLLGGGLSLADGIARSRLDVLLMGQLEGMQGIPGWLVIVAVCVTCVLFSEVASNTATAALLLPLTGTLAVALGYNSMFLMLPVALATSLGFMLPVATPPNALALSSGKISVWQMAIAGAVLNLVGLILIVGLLYLFGFPAFDVKTSRSFAG